MDFYKPLFEYELERSRDVARQIGKAKAKLLIADAVIATAKPETYAEKLQEVKGLIKEIDELLK